MDNKDLMNKWTQCFGIGLVITIIDFIIMVNQKDASTGAKITAIILLVGIVFCIISVVKINMYNAKVKKMSADEYLSDRFANAIPETKEVFGIKSNDKPSIECPYCHSTDVSKIGTVNRAVSVGMVGVASSKIGKQWHCNKCKSNF